ncbi:DUF1648 domain-containing protein [Streptomyces sp. SP17BM10]|uniref:DUF1648 domain-containing protein n=1 Tax=Streptomyces sp. SP17BM10 TaxID=3002530 RepID=UPI002E79EADF|nr:DUF1648 domain-containing protein [Streptomyces sp. SP17BM10]MEE1788554.1 DUF1648 domain-containing protein [Streptomyces sp. SP17BM10]
MKDSEPVVPAATQRRPGRGGPWAAGAFAAGVLALLVALPLAARDRLPDPVATHWGGSRPDGSMSLTAAALFPAVIWLGLVALAAAVRRFRGRQAPGAPGAVLASGGVLLSGAQASIVHANLDRARWQDAASMDAWVILIVLATGAAGLLTWLATRTPGTGTAAAGTAPTGPRGPVMTLPAGERVVWLSRTSNVWMQLAAALLGLGAAGTALAGATGLTSGHWPLTTTLAILALTTLACSSVQARVTAKGLDVGFGPFGWPKRHWSPADIGAARAERRTAAQAGGWGYRVNGLGTTVMLRGGECLVVESRQGQRFAVSVDDADRGAALLNSLAAGAATPAA